MPAPQPCIPYAQAQEGQGKQARTGSEQAAPMATAPAREAFWTCTGFMRPPTSTLVMNVDTVAPHSVITCSKWAHKGRVADCSLPVPSLSHTHSIKASSASPAGALPLELPRNARLSFSCAPRACAAHARH